MAYQVILTTIGEAKLAAGIINLTHMAIGDGGGSEYQPTGSEIELVNEVYRKPLSSYNVTGNKVVMQLSIPLADGGFYVREAGIFDEDGDMIYVANLATRYKPLPTEGSASDLSVTLVSTVSNLANLSVTVDGTAYVTHSILAVELSDKLDKTNDKATSTEAAAATNSDKFMTPETVYTAYGSADPIVLTGGSTHTHAIDESIITGTIAPMTIELADTGDYPKSKRNRIALTIANLSNSNWTINGKASGSTNVTLSIAGTTNNPPVYALDATSLPTIANGAITSNVFTASANAASAQTFDYVSSADISSITPQMKFMPGTVLTVDPASTTGSTKFNYSTSGKVQVGSKLLVDVAGTVSEITVTAGSENLTNIFDSSWQNLSFFETNNLFIVFGNGNNKLASSSDGVNFIYNATLPVAIKSLTYFNGKYYAGTSLSLSNGTASIYSSVDLVTWSIAHSSSFTNARSSGVATNGNILVAVYSCEYNGSTCQTYSSADGSLFIQRNSITHFAPSTPQCSVEDINYINGKFVVSFWHGLGYSNDGITWISSGRPTPSSPGTDGIAAISWTGNSYLISSYQYTLANLCGIMSSADFSTWNVKIGCGISNSAPGKIINHATTYIAISPNSGSIFYSIDSGDNWSSAALLNNYPQIYSLISNGFISAQSSTLNRWRSITGYSGWVNLGFGFGNYQFTMTSPSIAVPTWAGLGGQTEQYSVSATSTSSFTAATSPTYTRSGNVITATYEQVTGQSGTHVQLKASSLNSGDVLTQIGATLLTVGRQTINSKTSMTLAAGKVAMMLPTPNGWLST